MTIPFLLIGVGVALWVVALVFRVQLRHDLVPPVDTTGFRPARVRSAQRSSIAGLLPGDPALRPLAIAYARRAVTNIPLRFRYVPLLWAGFAAIAAALWLWLWLELGLLGLAALLFGVISATSLASHRALTNGRTLLAEHGAEYEAVHPDDPPA